MAQLAPEDKFAGLAPQDRLAKTIPDLDLEDAAGAQRRNSDRTGAQLPKARRWRCKGVTNSEGGGASFSRSAVALATSTGFYGRYAGTSHSIGVAVLAGEGTGMERDYDHASARHAGDLRSRRRDRPRRRRENGQAPEPAHDEIAEPCRWCFIPTRRRACSAISPGAISGAAIARGVSFLKDRMGQPVFAPGMHGHRRSAPPRAACVPSRLTAKASPTSAAP